MSKQAKSNTVPKLRFPEFKNSSEWNIEPLGELYSFKSTNSLSRENLNYEDGEVKNIHYGDIHTKFSTLFDITRENVPYINPSVSIDRIDLDSFCREGDMIFADASEDLKDVGKSIEIVNLNNEKLLSGLHTLHARQKRSKLIIGFGGHLFKSPNIRSQIQRESQGAKVFGISATRLSNIQVYYPQDRKEQQKIADCLSALDELITSQSEKLEALTSHKKGLIQRLFPSEGETVPKLRFKEFRDSAEWDEVPLKQVFTIFQGFAFSSNDSVPEGTRWLKIADVGIQKMVHDTPSFLPASYKDEYKRFLVKRGDYVIALTRPILSKKLKMAPVDDVYNESLLNQRVGKLISSRNIDFVYYLLQTTKLISDIEKSIAGSEPPNLSAQQIEDIKTRIPSEKEQNKIAEHLSSTDQLINAQSQKLEALELHKEGLIQRLFPDAGE